MFLKSKLTLHPDVCLLDSQSRIIREFRAVPKLLLSLSTSFHLHPHTVLADENWLRLTGATCKKFCTSSEFSDNATSAIKRTDGCLHLASSHGDGMMPGTGIFPLIRHITPPSGILNPFPSVHPIVIDCNITFSTETCGWNTLLQLKLSLAAAITYCGRNNLLRPQLFTSAAIVSFGRNWLLRSQFACGRN